MQHRIQAAPAANGQAGAALTLLGLAEALEPMIERIVQRAVRATVAELGLDSGSHPPAGNHAEGLIDTAETARRLGLSARTVFGLVEKSELVPRRIGGRVLFDPLEVAGYVDRAKDAPRSARGRKLTAANRLPTKPR